MHGLPRLYDVSVHAARLLDLQFHFIPSQGSYEGCLMFDLVFVNPRVEDSKFSILAILRGGDELSTVTDGNEAFGDPEDNLSPWKLAVLQEILAIYAKSVHTDIFASALSLKLAPPPSEMVTTAAHWLGVRA